MTQAIDVIVRPATPRDRSFILATWLRGAFYDVKGCLRPNQDEYFKRQGKRIEDLLLAKNTQVRIAGDSADPLWIAGYCVTSGTDLHWIYVRADYRRNGIAKLLTKDLTLTHVCNLTTLGAEISKQKGLIFKPEGASDVSRSHDQSRTYPCDERDQA